MLECMRRRKILLSVLAVFAMFAVAMGALYEHWIGFPRKIVGHWVHPDVTWYWTWYPPRGYPYPGLVQYAYTDAHGREIKHGPLVERGVRGDSVVLSRTGFYLEGQPHGIFIEYQTYWGTKLKETRYDHGKQLSVTYYSLPNLK
jgi:hypothetical protein